MTVSQIPYRVLARKYRPTKFSQVVGQDHAVQTLIHAFEQNRMAHAFIFTGVRGVGKTTTARLLARGLNCMGTDGTGGPTPEPCGTCAQCTAISTDSHVDVLEVDAASRTGVEDIRDLIEGVRYKPVMGRYKVYIIDEVHMLSRNAFNALLKTLEEPPTHVVFIFATTEIQKVPLTVLSRCQRFDLRRVDLPTMAAYFETLVKHENATIETEALHLICKSAEGSVRDGQSLLDQALTGATDHHITVAQVRIMLGLGDRTAIVHIFQQLMEGNLIETFKRVQILYENGAEPFQILQNLLDVTHTISLLKISPDASAQDLDIPGDIKDLCHTLAIQLPTPVLSYTWQLLLKGLGEIKEAPLPKPALEMVLIRIVHIMNMMENQGSSSVAPPQPLGPSGKNQREENLEENAREENPAALLAKELQAPPGAHMASLSPAPDVPTILPSPGPFIPQTFAELIKLCQEKREMLLAAMLEDSIHLITFEPGKMQYRLGNPKATGDLGKLNKLLREWTQMPWVFEAGQDSGENTIVQQRQERENILLSHEKVQELLHHFPGSKVETIH